MRIATVGTGYVGLVTGTCFADSGNQVTCVDIDPEKIEKLTRGEIPIYEPGLSELVQRNVQVDRLHFTLDLASAVEDADLVELCYMSADFREGLEAFLDKRPPQWRGV